ncbi:bestrophin-4-like isoform X1 [Neocloeon triangulifer]|uniref:bestrophin-4-like isoform X1 n=1 Tax=Neocloeon triangulifer TaxID=2078957 RepID=UPI00286F0F09|nr:bestrophin-4-like isoform X1 [Neocloeon triangulifer]
MTVSYQYEVASSTSGGFTRLLCKWRGSLYKLIYRELFLFLVAFGCLSIAYRNFFTLEQKLLFEKVVVYCDKFIALIPLSFVLGFYVTYVAGRWWQQYMAIPWPDKIMHCVALYVTGDDEYGRMLRRSLMRYLNLSLILVLRSISSAVKRRFPTLDHVVESGFMTRIELEMFVAVPNEEFNTYWIPSTWFISLLKQAKRSNRIMDSQGLKIIMEEFNEFRSKCGMLWSYDWVSIPLVYTQVVTIATYSFFLAALVGRQYVAGANKPFQMEIDTYIPVFTILQFFFFMGLLKVAEQLINPFGDDDEDFELNWLIDRHTKVSYLGVDILMSRSPPLVKDMYFDDVDMMLPYTEAAQAYKKKTYRGSVHDMMVPEGKQGMYLPEIVEEGQFAISRSATPRTSMMNLFPGQSLSPYEETGSFGRRNERTSPSPQPRLNAAYSSNGNVATPEIASAGTRRLQAGGQTSCNELGADLFAMLSEVDRQQRLGGRQMRRDSGVPSYPPSSLLGESLSRRSSSVMSEEPDTISVCSATAPVPPARSRLRYLLKRKHSNSTKKNVRWRAVQQTDVPPPSPDMSVNALVEHSTAFMLRQMIGPVTGGAEIEKGAVGAVALTRSMPNIQATDVEVDSEWPQASPPRKRTESVHVPKEVIKEVLANALLKPPEDHFVGNTHQHEETK